ncbi:AAA family ATPase [Geothermobacter hydrogeniphilus]|uniref:Cobyrinic acid a,c-diamide synthase n=1 Tax=Geothermobacter hydrogeniphilus TaxID=1969733 RepID=A0A1X0XLF7_9BACT|nr:AAA family ATPase [Geothermobacter hydrogeniphilus]ORJ53678.1 cobyrinic acid a,c-diamide synthase [Geothermobacter hydrogeniphilus]
MARKMFIAATGQNIGKTTLCLSLLHLARRKYDRVGFIKPIGPKPTLVDGVIVDKDAALMAGVFDMPAHLRHISPVVVPPGMTKDIIDGRIPREMLSERLLAAFEALEKSCDFIIIEGSGHPGVGTVLGLSNAQVARMLGASVLMVTGGGIGNVIDGVAANAALFEYESVPVRAVLVNKLIAEKREQTLDYLTRAMGHNAFELFGGFNYQPILANPTLRRVVSILGLNLHGDHESLQRIIHHVQIGAASTHRVAELLKNDTLLIVTSSRDELLVTLANLYSIPEYREKIVGLVIPGKHHVDRITQLILDRSGIPYLRTTNHTTAQLYQMITDDVSKLTPEDTEKLDLLRELAELRLDFDRLDELVAG